MNKILEIVAIKGLSKEDKFTDGQNIVVADYDDFIKYYDSW